MKNKIKEKGYVVGTWCDLPSAAAANVIASAGLDFLIVDMEHGPSDFKLAQEMVMAAKAEGAECLIRVPNANESDILKALDIGSAGVIVPRVQTFGDVERVISYSKYYPDGNRGYNPFTRALGYGATITTGQANSQTFIAIMIEDAESVDAVADIISNKQVDAVYLGIYDLAVSMGFAGDIKNKQVVAAASKAIKKIVEMGKVAGCMVSSQEDIDFYRKLGVKMFVYRVDTAVLFDAYKDILSKF